MHWRMLSVIVILSVALTTFAKDAPTTNPIGETIDPDNDCLITADGQRVTIVTSDTPHDFAAELHQWNAPRVLSKASGDFTIEVKVSGTFAPENVSQIEGRTPYNGAGILIVQDEQNHLSLQRASLFRDGKVRHYLNFELRQDGKQSKSQWQMDLKNADTWLRLERSGGQFKASASQDGKTWKSYKPIDTDLNDDVQVGVEAVNSTDKEFRCTFDGWKISHPSDADDNKSDKQPTTAP